MTQPWSGLPPDVLQAVDKLAEFKVRKGPEGTAFESMVREKERGNPRFAFLHDMSSPAHAYYQFRLVSLGAAPAAPSMGHLAPPPPLPPPQGWGPPPLPPPPPHPYSDRTLPLNASQLRGLPQHQQHHHHGGGGPLPPPPPSSYANIGMLVRGGESGPGSSSSSSGGGSSTTAAQPRDIMIHAGKKNFSTSEISV